jgi:hypothetical protein
MCYDTVSTSGTSIPSLIFNCTTTSAFCMNEIHDTTDDTYIVGILRRWYDLRPKIGGALS